MNNVAHYYEMIDEASRFSRNSRKIEFLTTNIVLETILPPHAKILDVGAGTGVYSFHYAEQQHEVVAVDITPKHIEAIKEKCQQRGLNMEAHVENAVDLSRFDSETFDVVMCFGPMYHLTNAADRDRCIRECLRILKKGGLLAIAYINKYSVIPMLATRDQRFIRDSVVNKVINEGVIVEGDEDCFWTDAFFTCPEEIEALLGRFEVTAVDHVGTDGISHTIQDYVDGLGEKEFESWMDYHIQTCRERSILGISTHGLYICKKD
ncbi:class I SAM-dependent methyltransferase [Paenibacillus tyrfis]|uniref:class I SAM-dependent methyltransferase n=1 Tax=Paenibacillus tyrfis TaxID=1501230 RepID=UPI00209E46D7|nr:class I SAM-dependent methyltransferase [Paenibacillus tyrfis]MCP1311382.1 class I SAM-dependent methyltransferase [Paenibacillus tyrfis]